MRIGMGYDVHRLVPHRKLVLGGITIPYKKGLSGHSDADVLVHAICDALLGAASLGDIGLHFPDTDAQYKDISSIILLDRVRKMLTRHGFTVINVDATIFAQAPKISPYRNDMQLKLSETLDIEPGRINIKATTTEGIGLIGNNHGIGAMGIVLVDEE